MTEETVTLVMYGQISFQDEISSSQAGEIIAYLGKPQQTDAARGSGKGLGVTPPDRASKRKRSRGKS